MIWGLYVHIPFCSRACPYCAHFKVESVDSSLHARFVEALLREARMEAPRWSGRPRTVFFGGGTPSLLSEALFARLVNGLKQIFDFSSVEEFTVEMNPEHVTPERLAFLQDLGVNRISVGVQSFSPRFLSFLGRTHTPEVLDRALRTLADSGIPTWNVDLMFGMAGQSIHDFREDLERALSYDPPHLSTYELTLEPGTPFFHRMKQGKILLSDESLRESMYRLREDVLTRAGRMRYEISNYARPGHESRHNLLYWKRQNVLGLGPGASTLQGKIRWTNRHRLDGYIHQLERGTPPPRTVERLTEREILLERVFLGLRLSEGMALPSPVRAKVMETLSPLVEETPRGLCLAFPGGVLRAEGIAVRIVELWEEEHERLDPRPVS